MKLSHLPLEAKERFFNNACSDREYGFIIDLLNQSDEEEVILFMTEHIEAIDKNKIRLEKSPGPGLDRILSRVRSRVKNSRRRTLAMASIPIAASLIFFALIFLSDRSNHIYTELSSIRETHQQEKIDYYTPYGTQGNIDLHDGSKVRISSGSKMTFPKMFNGMKREVQLNGQAFFEIKKDTTKPFIIHSQGLKIQVLGTSFNVTSFEEDRFSRITVVEGSVKVEVSNKKEFFILQRNEQLYLDKKTGMVGIRKVDALESIAWTNGILRFENAGLQEVFRQMERWYNVHFEIDIELAETCRVSGQHENEGLEKVLEALSFTHGVEYSFLSDDHIRIVQMDCK